MSGGNRNVADTKEDCKVCDSGQYQHENKQTECINCPEGTVRYVDTSDNDVWNGANVLDTFHEFTIGHCEETGDNLISSKTINGPISSYFSDAFQQYVVAATTKCNSDSNCEYVSVWDDGDYRLYKNACTPGYVTKTDSSPPDMSVSEIECARYGTDNSLTWQGNHHVNINNPKGCFTDGSSNIYYNKAATGVTCGGTYTCIENGLSNKVYNEVDVIVDEQNVVWDGIVGYWYPVTYKKIIPVAGTSGELGDRLVANTKSDCKVCPSGRYQEEDGLMECKNCPEGTIRYYDKYEDSKRWDSGLSGDQYTATVWEIKNAGQTGYYVESDQNKKCATGTANPPDCSTVAGSGNACEIMSFDACLDECKLDTNCKYFSFHPDDATNTCILCDVTPTDTWTGSIVYKMGGRPKVNNVQFFTDDTCSDSIPLTSVSNEIVLTSSMITCSGIKSDTTPCATALLSTTNQYWEPDCDPCYVDEAWFKVTFTTITTVRCIQLNGIHPLGKSEGDTADLIWSGGLHVLNNNGLNDVSVNSNKWNGRGIGDRLVADTKADCKVCPSGMYQQEVGKLECKNCPAGTIRAISSNDDDIHWNGDSGGNDGDRTKADDEPDCKVCEAG